MPYKDPAKVRAKCRAYYEKNKHNWHKYDRAKRYGITLDEIEVQRAKQKGYCAICAKPKKLVIDHCHTTKKFRGLLCGQCNTLLGMAYDNQDILKNAVEYLKKSVES